MKNILVLIIIYFSLSVFGELIAQTDVKSNSELKYIYCELVGRQKFLSTKITISVDFGEERFFFKDTRLRDEQTGKVQTFNSMIDALNYMGKDGWEFVQAYIVTQGEQSVYHWLLKKRID